LHWSRTSIRSQKFNFYQKESPGANAKVSPGATQEIKGAIKIAVVILVVVKQNGID